MGRDLAIGLILAPAFGEKGSFIPLGLAYLNGALRDAGYAPSFADCSAQLREVDPALYGELVSVGFSPNEGGFFGPELALLLEIGRREAFDEAPLADRILARATEAAQTLEGLDLALLTLWDSNLYFALALGIALRQQGTTVALGGPGAQLPQVRELLLRLGGADIIVVGEGEERVVEIARRMGSGQDLTGIAGTTVLESGRAFEAPGAPPLLIHDIPRPGFEGFDVDAWLPVLTSRGCIRDCSFCTEKFFWARYRQRKVEDVIAELEVRVEREEVTRFEFNDDLLNGNPRWLNRFCDALIERQWPIRWICFMEPYRLSDALIDKVAKAGCTLIKFGVQHFDPAMLRTIGRGDEIGEVVGTLARAAQNGMRVHFDLIPGHPGETEEQHAVNLANLPEVLGADPRIEVNINPFLLLYGSPVEWAPDRFGVSIERWDETLLPEAVRDEFRDLAPSFIRSYAQEPPRDTVADRTRQLEALVRRSRGRHTMVALRVGETGLEESLSSLKREGAKGLALRPGDACTARDLLEAISAAHEKGFGPIAVEAAAAPFDRAAFVREASALDLDHAILNGSGDVPEFERAGRCLTEGGVRWVLSLRPRARELMECRAWVERAGRAGASSVALALDQALVGDDAVSFATAATAATRAIAHGQALGVDVHIYGLPFCLVADAEEQLMTRPLVASDEESEAGGEVVVQAPVCRSCGWAVRCPGAPRGALEREGEAMLRPVSGRPVEDPHGRIQDGIPA